MTPERLDRAFFARPTEVVAEDLVGCRLSRRTTDGLVGGVIVETEAYGGPEDAASHAALYPRSRATIMGSQPGTAYVYRSYGIHSCFNVVAKREGGVGAVLIRAVEPTLGMELMRVRRGTRADVDLCRGPGRLCQAFAITTADAYEDVVVSDNLWFGPRDTLLAVSRSSRVGITRGVDALWRFFVDGSRFVSAARAVPRRAVR